MKFKVLLIFLIVLLVLYLNYTYSNFYNYQGSHFLKNPPYSQLQELKNNKGNELRLVILGDSLMAGTGTFESNKSLGYLIAEHFAKERDVSLVNLAIPGVGVKHVFEVQVPEAVSQNPEQVFLMIGTNDVHNKLPDSEFKKYYHESLRALTAQTKAQITLVNIPYIGSDLILYAPWNKVLDGRIREFNKIISEEASAKGIKMIDLYTPFREQFNSHSELYSLDEFHPSEKGYKLWADYINASIN